MKLAGKFFLLALFVLSVSARRRRVKLKLQPSSEECEVVQNYEAGFKYSYSYEATVESRNELESTQAFTAARMRCLFVNITVPTSCVGVMNMADCLVDDGRLSSSTNRTIWNTNNRRSRTFDKSMSKNPVYFQFNKGEISKVFIHNHEPVEIANLKRAVLSALQLKFEGNGLVASAVTPVDQIPETSIFGEGFIQRRTQPREDQEESDNDDEIEEFAKTVVVDRSLQNFTLPWENDLVHFNMEGFGNGYFINHLVKRMSASALHHQHHQTCSYTMEKGRRVASTECVESRPITMFADLLSMITGTTLGEHLMSTTITTQLVGRDAENMSRKDIISDSEKRKLNKYYLENSLMYRSQEESDRQTEAESLSSNFVDLFADIVSSQANVEKADSSTKIVKILKQSALKDIISMEMDVFSRYQNDNLDTVRLVWLKLLQRCATSQTLCTNPDCQCDNVNCGKIQCQGGLKYHIDKIRNDGALSPLKSDVMQALVAITNPDPALVETALSLCSMNAATPSDILSLGRVTTNYMTSCGDECNDETIGQVMEYFSAQLGRECTPYSSDAESTAKMVAVIKSMATFGRNAGGVAQTLLNCARNRDVHEKIPLAAITSLKQLPNELLSQVQVRDLIDTSSTPSDVRIVAFIMLMSRDDVNPKEIFYTMNAAAAPATPKAVTTFVRKYLQSQLLLRKTRLTDLTKAASKNLLTALEREGNPLQLNLDLSPARSDEYEKTWEMFVPFLNKHYNFTLKGDLLYSSESSILPIGANVTLSTEVMGEHLELVNLISDFSAIEPFLDNRLTEFFRMPISKLFQHQSDIRNIPLLDDDEKDNLRSLLDEGSLMYSLLRMKNTAPVSVKILSTYFDLGIHEIYKMFELPKTFSMLDLFNYVQQLENGINFNDIKMTQPFQLKAAVPTSLGGQHVTQIDAAYFHDIFVNILIPVREMFFNRQGSSAVQINPKLDLTASLSSFVQLPSGLSSGTGYSFSASHNTNIDTSVELTQNSLVISSDPGQLDEHFLIIDVGETLNQYSVMEKLEPENECNVYWSNCQLTQCQNKGLSVQACFTPLINMLLERGEERNGRIEFITEWGSQTEDDSGLQSYALDMKVNKKRINEFGEGTNLYSVQMKYIPAINEVQLALNPNTDDQWQIIANAMRFNENGQNIGFIISTNITTPTTEEYPNILRVIKQQDEQQASSSYSSWWGGSSNEEDNSNRWNIDGTLSLLSPLFHIPVLYTTNGQVILEDDEYAVEFKVSKEEGNGDFIDNYISTTMGSTILSTGEGKQYLSFNFDERFSDVMPFSGMNFELSRNEEISLRSDVTNWDETSDFLFLDFVTSHPITTEDSDSMYFNVTLTANAGQAIVKFESKNMSHCDVQLSTLTTFDGLVKKSAVSEDNHIVNLISDQTIGGNRLSFDYLFSLTTDGEYTSQLSYLEKPEIAPFYNHMLDIPYQRFVMANIVIKPRQCFGCHEIVLTLPCSFEQGAPLANITSTNSFIDSIMTTQASLKAPKTCSIIPAALKEYFVDDEQNVNVGFNFAYKKHSFLNGQTDLMYQIGSRSLTTNYVYSNVIPTPSFDFSIDCKSCLPFTFFDGETKLHSLVAAVPNGNDLGSGSLRFGFEGSSHRENVALQASVDTIGYIVNQNLNQVDFKLFTSSQCDDSPANTFAIDGAGLMDENRQLITELNVTRNGVESRRAKLTVGMETPSVLLVSLSYCNDEDAVCEMNSDQGGFARLGLEGNIDFNCGDDCHVQCNWGFEDDDRFAVDSMIRNYFFTQAFYWKSEQGRPLASINTLRYKLDSGDVWSNELNMEHGALKTLLLKGDHLLHIMGEAYSWDIAFHNVDLPSSDLPEFVRAEDLVPMAESVKGLNVNFFSELGAVTLCAVTNMMPTNTFGKSRFETTSTLPGMQYNISAVYDDGQINVVEARSPEWLITFIDSVESNNRHNTVFSLKEKHACDCVFCTCCADVPIAFDLNVQWLNDFTDMEGQTTLTSTTFNHTNSWTGGLDRKRVFNIETLTLHQEYDTATNKHPVVSDFEMTQSKIFPKTLLTFNLMRSSGDDWSTDFRVKRNKITKLALSGTEIPGPLMHPPITYNFMYENDKSQHLFNVGTIVSIYNYSMDAAYFKGPNSVLHESELDSPEVSGFRCNFTNSDGFISGKYVNHFISEQPNIHFINEVFLDANMLSLNKMYWLSSDDSMTRTDFNFKSYFELEKLRANKYKVYWKAGVADLNDLTLDYRIMPIFVPSISVGVTGSTSYTQTSATHPVSVNINKDIFYSYSDNYVTVDSDASVESNRWNHTAVVKYTQENNFKVETNNTFASTTFTPSVEYYLLTAYESESINLATNLKVADSFVQSISYNDNHFSLRGDNLIIFEVPITYDVMLNNDENEGIKMVSEFTFETVDALRLSFEGEPSATDLMSYHGVFNADFSKLLQVVHTTEVTINEPNKPLEIDTNTQMSLPRIIEGPMTFKFYLLNDADGLDLSTLLTLLDETSSLEIVRSRLTELLLQMPSFYLPILTSQPLGYSLGYRVTPSVDALQIENTESWLELTCGEENGVNIQYYSGTNNLEDSDVEFNDNLNTQDDVTLFDAASMKIRINRIGETSAEVTMHRDLDTTERTSAKVNLFSNMYPFHTRGIYEMTFPVTMGNLNVTLTNKLFSADKRAVSMLASVGNVASELIYEFSTGPAWLVNGNTTVTVSSPFSENDEPVGIAMQNDIELNADMSAVDLGLVIKTFGLNCNNAKLEIHDKVKTAYPLFVKHAMTFDSKPFDIVNDFKITGQDGVFTLEMSKTKDDETDVMLSVDVKKDGDELDITNLKLPLGEYSLAMDELVIDMNLQTDEIHLDEQELTITSSDGDSVMYFCKVDFSAADLSFLLRIRNDTSDIVKIDLDPVFINYFLNKLEWQSPKRYETSLNGNMQVLMNFNIFSFNLVSEVEGGVAGRSNGGEWTQWTAESQMKLVSPSASENAVELVYHFTKTPTGSDYQRQLTVADYTVAAVHLTSELSPSTFSYENGQDISYKFSFETDLLESQEPVVTANVTFVDLTSEDNQIVEFSSCSFDADLLYPSHRSLTGNINQVGDGSYHVTSGFHGDYHQQQVEFDVRIDACTQVSDYSVCIPTSASISNFETAKDCSLNSFWFNSFNLDSGLLSWTYNSDTIDVELSGNVVVCSIEDPVNIHLHVMTNGDAKLFNASVMHGPKSMSVLQHFEQDDRTYLLQLMTMTEWFIGQWESNTVGWDVTGITTEFKTLGYVNEKLPASVKVQYNQQPTKVKPNMIRFAVTDTRDDSALNVSFVQHAVESNPATAPPPSLYDLMWNITMPRRHRIYSHAAEVVAVLNSDSFSDADFDLTFESAFGWTQLNVNSLHIQEGSISIGFKDSQTGMKIRMPASDQINMLWSMEDGRQYTCRVTTHSEWYDSAEIRCYKLDAEDDSGELVAQYDVSLTGLLRDLENPLVLYELIKFDYHQLMNETWIRHVMETTLKVTDEELLDQVPPFIVHEIKAMYSTLYPSQDLMTTVKRVVRYMVTMQSWQPGNIVKTFEALLTLLGTPTNWNLIHKELKFGLLDVNLRYMDKTAPDDIKFTTTFDSSMYPLMDFSTMIGLHTTDSADVVLLLALTSPITNTSFSFNIKDFTVGFDYSVMKSLVLGNYVFEWDWNKPEVSMAFVDSEGNPNKCYVALTSDRFISTQCLVRRSLEDYVTGQVAIKVGSPMELYRAYRQHGFNAIVKDVGPFDFHSLRLLRKKVQDLVRNMLHRFDVNGFAATEDMVEHYSEIYDACDRQAREVENHSTAYKLWCFIPQVIDDVLIQFTPESRSRQFNWQFSPLLPYSSGSASYLWQRDMIATYNASVAMQLQSRQLPYINFAVEMDVLHVDNEHVTFQMKFEHLLFTSGATFDLRNLEIVQLMFSPLKTLMFKIEDIHVNRKGMSANASFVDPNGQQNTCQFQMSRKLVIELECYVGEQIEENKFNDLVFEIEPWMMDPQELGQWALEAYFSSNLETNQDLMAFLQEGFGFTDTAAGNAQLEMIARELFFAYIALPSSIVQVEDPDWSLMESAYPSLEKFDFLRQFWLNVRRDVNYDVTNEEQSVKYMKIFMHLVEFAKEFYHVGKEEETAIGQIIYELSKYTKGLRQAWTELEQVLGDMTHNVMVFPGRLSSPVQMMRHVNVNMQDVYDMITSLIDLMKRPQAIWELKNELLNLDTLTNFAGHLLTMDHNELHSASRFIGMLAGQQVTTWNGTTININTFTEGCSRVLAADMMKKHFIVLVKEEKVIVVLPSSMLMLDLNTLTLTNHQMEGELLPYLVTDDAVCVQQDENKLRCQTSFLNVVLERSKLGTVTLELMLNPNDAEYVGGLHGAHSKSITIPEISVIDDMQQQSSVDDFKNQFVLSRGMQC